MKQNHQNDIQLPECGIFFGSGVYNGYPGYLVRSGRTHTAWIPACPSPLDTLDKIVEENQGNLAQFWGLKGGWGFNGERAPVPMGRYLALEDLGIAVPEPNWKDGQNITIEDSDAYLGHPERYGAGLLKFIQAAAEKQIYTMCIYCNALPEWSQRFKEAGKYYLGYDFGERYSFVLEEDHLEGHSDEITLQSLADNLMRQVRTHVEERKSGGWGLVMATSASFHIDYEIAAGTDVPLIEDFAFPHLNMASSLGRGLYRQYHLPIWGSHIAHEHYSWTPYSDPNKFHLLTAGFFQKYMAGAKIILNESGNWFLQTVKSTDSPLFDLPRVELDHVKNTDPILAAPYVEKAQEQFEKIGYDSPIASTFRRRVSDFYNFVKTHGTPEGQPEVTLAVIKGNNDLCGNEFSPNGAVAGMYDLAEKNPRWFEGQPERGWNIVKQVFYPRPPVLAPYLNRFLSGTPHGMVDIVSFAADQVEADFLKRYRALLFSGWNTASLHQYRELIRFVQGGGTLFLSIPHLSTDIRRNYVSYTTDDLVLQGDFSELCGVKIHGKGPRFYWATAPDRKGELGFEFPRRFGIFTTRLGEMEITDPAAEILAVDDEEMRPLLIRRRCGKGTVYFLNSWSYPGALDRDEGPGSTLDSPGLIGFIYRHIARKNRGSTWITPDEGAADRGIDSIAYSYFPKSDTICLQNIDFQKKQHCLLHHHGTTTPVGLEPGAFQMLSATGSSKVDYKIRPDDPGN